jgi:hypothetical protein
LSVSKKGFKVFNEHLKDSPYIAKVKKQVQQAFSVIIEEYVESSPYPNRVKKNLLTTVANKCAIRCHESYEKITMKSQFRPSKNK